MTLFSEHYKTLRSLIIENETEKVKGILGKFTLEREDRISLILTCIDYNRISFAKYLYYYFEAHNKKYLYPAPFLIEEGAIHIGTSLLLRMLNNIIMWSYDKYNVDIYESIIQRYKYMIRWLFITIKDVPKDPYIKYDFYSKICINIVFYKTYIILRKREWYTKLNNRYFVHVP